MYCSLYENSVNFVTDLSMKQFAIYLSFSFLVLLGSCRNTNNSTMPYVPVDIYINVSLPAYSNLNVIGGWAYVTGGNDGILLYRQSFESILAYERRCTYNAFEACGFSSVDSTNVVVECACDGSRYSLFDGSVIEGPATAPLFRYNTTFNVNFGDVHIFN